MFKEKRDSNERDQYVNEFGNFLKSIYDNDLQGKVEIFSGNQDQISQDFWNSINDNLNNNQKYFKSQIFKNSVKDLISTTASM